MVFSSSKLNLSKKDWDEGGIQSKTGYEFLGLGHKTFLLSLTFTRNKRDANILKCKKVTSIFS